MARCNEPIVLTERYEYAYCVAHGYEPLLDIRKFRLDIRLRVELQRELFGHHDILAANQRFFRWVWEHKPHRCEETLRPLYNYSAVYCSHILTRGAYPEMAHDPRNINILCFEMHNRWEIGDRKHMRIYPKNLRVIEMLKKEYQNLRL